MIIEKNELLKLAYEGIQARIDKKSDQIKLGNRILESRKTDFPVYSPLSDEDVKLTIVRLKQERIELQEYRQDIKSADEFEGLEII